MYKFNIVVEETPRMEFSIEWPDPFPPDVVSFKNTNGILVKVGQYPKARGMPRDDYRYKRPSVYNQKLLPIISSDTPTVGFTRVDITENEFARFLFRVRAIENYSTIAAANTWWAPDGTSVAMCIYTAIGNDVNYWIRSDLLQSDMTVHVEPAPDQEIMDWEEMRHWTLEHYSRAVRRFAGRSLGELKSERIRLDRKLDGLDLTSENRGLRRFAPGSSGLPMWKWQVAFAWINAEINIRTDLNDEL